MNPSQLFELAQYLDPRHHDVLRRRDALKQIIGMPSIESQVYDAWTAVPETPTPGKDVSEFPRRSASQHSSEFISSTYGIRQGLYDALADEDEELNVTFYLTQLRFFLVSCIEIYLQGTFFSIWYCKRFLRSFRWVNSRIILPCF